jgi:hypothetical protein
MFGIAVNNRKSGNKLASLPGHGKAAGLSEEQLRDLNFDYLMGLTKYLVRQKKEGTINDKEFSFLIRTVGGNFVGREMEIRIRKAFRKFF